ncbi:MAG: hypothetical protein GHCLOJNM_01585 [bacterium]|nr:hypothetical protein [bacterium]
MSAVVDATNGWTILVDEDLFEVLDAYEWHVFVNRAGNPYAVSREAGSRSALRMQRLVWSLARGPIPPGMVVDHRVHLEGEVIDNRISNLRVASVSQNNSNSRDRSSRHGRGVAASGSGRTFWARVSRGGEVYRRGPFLSPEAARVAYREMALRVHGEFAFGARA